MRPRIVAHLTVLPGASFRPCIGHPVRLPAGEYILGAYAVSRSHRTDPDLEEELLTVRVAGTYKSEACRGWNSRIRDYQIRSTMRQGGVVSSTILNTFSRDPLAEPGPIHVYGDGNYEWAGRIVRYTPDATEPSV
jgi:hypothetical protein